MSSSDPENFLPRSLAPAPAQHGALRPRGQVNDPARKKEEVVGGGGGWQVEWREERKGSRPKIESCDRREETDFLVLGGKQILNRVVGGSLRGERRVEEFPSRIK